MRILLLSLLSLFSMSLYAAQPTITLTVTNQNKQPIKQVKPGAYFQVQVVLTDGSREQAQVAVDGLQNFFKLGASSSNHIMMMNNSWLVERTYQYTMRADRAGSFTIGPAHAKIGDTELVSNAVQVLVDEKASEASSGATTHNQEQTGPPPAFLELIPNKKSAYVGEPMDIMLKLWLAPGVQCPSGLALPEGDWHIKRIGETVQSTKVRGSTQYQLVEQRLRLVAKQPGLLQFPTVNIQCLVPVHMHHMFNIFGPRMQEQTVSSEPFTLEIKQLPPNRVPANAVGLFNRFSARVDRTKARVGEGLVYTLLIEGQADASDFDADTVPAPVLQLPEGLTAYASQQEVKQITPHTWQKSFEYIVQGARAGQHTLPAQQFVYFEPYTEQYYTLHTKPITLQIDALAQKKQKDTPRVTQPEQKSLGQEQLPPSLPTTSYYERWRSYINTYSTYELLVLALLMGILFVLGIGLMVYVLKKSIAWFRARRGSAIQRLAFSRAHKELARLKKTGNVSGLLSMITNLFAARAQVAMPTVTESWMRSYLQQQNMPEEHINIWLRDVGQLQQYAFYEGGLSASKSMDAQLFDRFAGWLAELEKWI